MAEEKQGSEQGQVDGAEAELSIDAKIEAARAEAMAEVTERYKSEISGLNRKNSEVMAELTELKKSSMSEKEKLQFDLEREKAEITALRADFTKEQNRAKATAKAVELGVPVEMLEPLNMSGEWDSISGQIDKFKAVVNGLQSKFADSFAKGNGDDVKRGASTGKKASEYTADEMTELWKTNPTEAQAILAELKRK